MGEERGGGEAGGGVGFSVVLFPSVLSLIFFISFVFLLLYRGFLAAGAARKPHHDGDLRRNRSGGEKGFGICCHDLYRSNAEMVNKKKKSVKYISDESAGRGELHEKESKRRKERVNHVPQLDSNAGAKEILNDSKNICYLAPTL